MSGRTENPYQSVELKGTGSLDQQNDLYSRRSMRYAALGAVAGFGFGIAMLVFTIRHSIQSRPLDDADFQIDYLTPLFALVYWSVTAGSVLSVVGGVIGLVADWVRPIASTDCSQEDEQAKTFPNG